MSTTQISSEPWFVLNDVCAAAGIKNPSQTKKRLDQELLRTTEVLAGDNKMRETSIINEAGLYDVVRLSVL